MSSPTRESIQKSLTEVIRLSYDSMKKQERELTNAINDITLFFLHPSEKNDKVPYQYKEENQMDFYIPANKVSLSLSQVEPVLADMKTRMYNLEKGNQVIEIPSSPDQSTPLTVKTPEPKQPIIRNPFAKSKKPAPTNPYQSALPLMKRTETVIHNWELVMEYQANGVDLANEDFDMSGSLDYLGYHRNMFQWLVAPQILRIFKQGWELQIEKEKQYAQQTLVANMKEAFTMRNDFMNQPH